MVASLVRRLGDIDLAEEAAGEALVVALERWPVDGVPPNPGAWLTTTAANRAIDRLRRESRRDAKHQAAPMIEDDDPARGHRRRRGRPAPAGLHLLPPGARPRGAGGPHPAAARRAHRGRDRARRSWCPRPRWPSGSPAPSARSRTPASPTGCRGPTTWPRGSARCSPWSTSSSTRATSPARGDAPVRADLTGEAIRLGRLLRELLPDEPEVAGLLALMLLTEARREARFAGGELVPLDEQDRSGWDRGADRRGPRPGPRVPGRATGPGRLPAAGRVNAVHTDARHRRRHRLAPDRRALRPAAWRSTPSPVVAPQPGGRRGRAGRPRGRAGRGRPARRSPATTPGTPRAPTCCAALGRSAEARAAYDAAIAATDNAAERAYLARRRGQTGARCSAEVP